MSPGRSVALRLVVTLGIAFVIVAFAGIAPLLAPAGGGGTDSGTNHPEYAVDRVNPDRLESSGVADPRGDVGVVLFDRTHDNRFETEDVSALTRAIEEAGGDVRYTGVSNGFQSELSRADVLVIVDPGTSYGTGEVDAIEQFVDDGGRVIVLGEPNRKDVEAEGLQASLVVQRSMVTTVASRFGISVGSRYLYDMEHNDGNFKNVVTSPPDRADADVVEGVDQVALYTAATVDTNRGTVLLRTAETAERADGSTRAGFPVAVLSPGGNVLVVGDTTFLGEEYHAVADNDVFLERIVEFMAGADASGAQRSGSNGAGDSDGTNQTNREGDRAALAVARPAG